MSTWEQRTRKEEKNMNAQINPEAITIQDCLDNYQMKKMAAIINDGQVIDFKKEED